MYAVTLWFVTAFGGAGTIRTYAMTGSNPVALPLGYDPTLKNRSRRPLPWWAFPHGTWPATWPGAACYVFKMLSTASMARRRQRVESPSEGGAHVGQCSLPCLRRFSPPGHGFLRPLLGSRAFSTTGTHLPLAGAMAVCVCSQWPSAGLFRPAARFVRAVKSSCRPAGGTRELRRPGIGPGMAAACITGFIVVPSYDRGAFPMSTRSRTPAPQLSIFRLCQGVVPDGRPGGGLWGRYPDARAVPAAWKFAARYSANARSHGHAT